MQEHSGLTLTQVTRHVCNDKSFFKTFEAIEDETIIYKRNESSNGA